MKTANLFKILKIYWAEEDGVTGAEYAVLIGFFVLGMLAAWETFGSFFGRSLMHSVEVFDELGSG